MTFNEILLEELLLEAQQVPSGKKYLLLLDLDETLVQPGPIYIYRKLPTESKEVKLTPAEFAKEDVSGDKEKYYDFRDFRDAKKVEQSITKGKPMWRNLRLMDAHINAGWQVGILTARGMEDVIFKALNKWLMFKDSKGNLKSIQEVLSRNLVNAINDSVKVYKGKSTFDKKANVIKSYIDKGYDKIKFVDDTSSNIEAVRKMAKEEGIQDKVQAVLAQGI